MCGEPVRANRGGLAGRSASGNIWKWVIIGTVVGVVGMGACCGVGFWLVGVAFDKAQQEFVQTRAEMEAARKARTVVAKAADLLREFESDAARAEKKYKGKYLELTGVVERVGGGKDDPHFVILHGGDENARLKIECFFDLADEDDDLVLQVLETGRTITLRGEFAGRVSNLQLRQCELAK
jgi:hypothetical protein